MTSHQFRANGTLYLVNQGIKRCNSEIFINFIDVIDDETNLQKVKYDYD